MATKPQPQAADPVSLADYRPVAGQPARHDGWTAPLTSRNRRNIRLVRASYTAAAR